LNMKSELYWLRFGEFLYEEHPDLYSELCEGFENSKWYKKEES